MNDAEYIAAIAEFYKDGPGPEFRAHYERLMHISAAIAAKPAQPRDDAVFVVWWSDHMPNSTEADAWAEWCSLRSNQPAAQAQAVTVKPSLSYGTARCQGGADKLLCQTCLRLLAPGNPYGQWFMTPPASIERGECASHISAVRLQPILPSTNGATHNA